MATSDSELETEVREFTDTPTSVVSVDSFETVLDDAKRHIKVERSLSDQETNWYNEPHQEEALNWTTKLFLMVATGELDSQTIQVGAIDHKSLLSKDSDDVTIWYRNMRKALKRVNPTNSYGITSPERRVYGGEDEQDNTTGL